jgi:putative membrane protein
LHACDGRLRAAGNALTLAVHRVYKELLAMRRLLGTGLCIMLAAACARDDADDTARQLEMAELTESAEAAVELLAPVRATSAVIIEFNDMAVERSARVDVREYAITLGADHRAVIQAMDSAAQARGVAIRETAAAQELANSVRMAHSGLSALSGDEFDLAFIRAQVESHRQLLDRLELELVPGATSADMQRLLGDVRAMEAAHLTRARQILASLLGQATEPGSGSPQGDSPTAPPTGPTPPPGG